MLDMYEKEYIRDVKNESTNKIISDSFPKQSNDPSIYAGSIWDWLIYQKEFKDTDYKSQSLSYFTRSDDTRYKSAPYIIFKNDKLCDVVWDKLTSLPGKKVSVSDEFEKKYYDGYVLTKMGLVIVKYNRNIEVHKKSTIAKLNSPWHLRE